MSKNKRENVVVEVRPVESSTMGDQVYQELKALLMTGVIAPGSRLSLRPFARQFGTSSMPVRDAMRRLVVEGGLRMTRTRGFESPEYDAAEFMRLMQMRAEIEAVAIRFAARKPLGKQEMEPIWGAALAFEAESRKATPDGPRLQQLNKELHFAIYAQCGEPFLVETIERLWMMVGPTVRHYFSVPDESRLEPAARHHRSLIEALERGDGEAAADSLKRDILDGGARITSAGSLARDRKRTLSSKGGASA